MGKFELIWCFLLISEDGFDQDTTVKVIMATKLGVVAEGLAGFGLPASQRELEFGSCHSNPPIGIPFLWKSSWQWNISHPESATHPRNRADTLDPALLRPGRLDRKIEFPLPDRRHLADSIKKIPPSWEVSKRTLCQMRSKEVDLSDHHIQNEPQRGHRMTPGMLDAMVHMLRVGYLIFGEFLSPLTANGCSSRGVQINTS